MDRSAGRQPDRATAGVPVGSQRQFGFGDNGGAGASAVRHGCALWGALLLGCALLLLASPAASAAKRASKAIGTPIAPVQAAASPASTNLLVNGGFEKGTGDAPAGWSRTEWVPGASLTRDSAKAHSGGYSARISASDPNDVRWTQTVPVRPNTMYRLSGWIKTSNVVSVDALADAGANLSFDGTWTHTAGLVGTRGWTHVAVSMWSGDTTELTVAARLGYWSGLTSGTAWYDDLRLDEVAPQAPAPAWRILALIYGETDFSYGDSSGQQHVVGTTSRRQQADAAKAVTAFVTQDIPALDSGRMVPTLKVRYPNHPLTALDPHGEGWWPSPANTAADRDPAFDAVIVIWNPNVTDQATGQKRFIGSAAGLTPDMGVGQTYTTLIMDAATGYGHRNVFKHEFGHSILSFFASVGTAPQPPVANHAAATTYVNCRSGQPYVWIDETLADPIPNSIYNNTSGFTHDYYSGTTALASDPTHCLGVTPLAWEYGGPLTLSAHRRVRVQVPG